MCGLVKSRDANSRLAYYEVTNAQHVDAFIDNAAAPGYDTRAVPLHLYFNRAMDIMYNHLKNGTAPIPATPAASDTITFTNNTLTIPD